MSGVVNGHGTFTPARESAQLATTPLVLLYFNQFPNYFFLTNIGLLILAGVALIGVVLFFLLHFIPWVVDAVAYVVNLIFEVLNQFIVWINTLPGEVSTGFTPYIFQVILLYFGILFSLYHWNKGHVKFFKLGILVLFVSSLSLIFNREYNKSKEELIVFNHYEKVILLKGNRMLYVLYDGEKRPTLSSLDYLINGYENASGIKAEKIPLPRDFRISFSDNIHFQNGKDGIQMDYYGKHYFLAQKVNDQMANSDYKIIKGDWNPYLQESNVSANTIESALIVKSSGK